MVQLLEELPPELQAHIAGSLDTAAAAGRWVQASRASRLLLMPRLEQLLEVQCSARQQAICSISSAAHGASLPRSASQGGHFAINLPASGAQLRPSMATFTCMCCGDGCTWRCGNGQCFRQCEDASGFQSALEKTPPPIVYDLDDEYTAWKAFAASVRGLGSSV